MKKVTSLNICIKCKKLVICGLIRNDKKNRFEWWCKECIKFSPKEEDIIKYGYKRAYRKEYYKRTGR